MPRKPAEPAKKKKRAKVRAKSAPAPAIADKTVDPHVAKALDYCHQVLTGKIPACKWVRAACQRQLNDLEREKTNPNYLYRFDQGKAGRICRFLEQLPHVKGPKRGELFKLELWQCFIFTTVFGWVKKSNGQRRFRRVYIEIPRGNGKSFMSSGLGLYGLAADGEGGADIYSAATTTEQANITRGDADAMLKARPALSAKLGLRCSTHAITQPSTNSSFKALSREAKNQEGKNIHIALVDELHVHPTREIWDVLVMGSAKRTQSLIWAITTAGVDFSGICYEVRGTVTRMLDGAENEQLFGIIYTLDEGDDWKLESSWVKANPNWSASIDLDVFRMDAVEAMQNASKENNFKTKHLNVWCSADVAWMSMDAWDACADSTLREADFAGRPCVDGLDLASKTDLAARSKIFWKDFPAGVDDKTGEPKTVRHYYCFVKNYLPELAVETSKNSQYEGWVKEGHITTTPGNVLDFEAVKSTLRQDRADHDLLEVAYDPWQALQLANEMQEEGAVMVELRPTVQNFSEPMKEWHALVLTKRFHHTGDPCFRWQVSNVVSHRDAKENIYPRKQKPENKIDAPVATITALNRALLAPAAPESPYADRGFRTL